MRPLVNALVVLTIAAAKMAYINTLENDKFVGKTNVKTMAINKQGIEDREENSQESLNSFIEEKLMHQSQALEHLVEGVDKIGDLIKKLIDNLSKGLEKPKMPAKAVVEEVTPLQSRRSNNASIVHPIVLLGKNIPKYGKLAKDLIMKDVYSDTDPTPLIEKNTNTPLPRSGSRRSFGGDPVSPSKQSDDTKPNPWCPIALLCQKTIDPVCGFDDDFGYGRFEDFCHLLRVNCYWKYNFSVVNSCRPKL